MAAGEPQVEQLAPPPRQQVSPTTNEHAAQPHLRLQSTLSPVACICFGSSEHFDHIDYSPL